MKAFIIDDNRSQRNIFQELLEEYGCETSSFEDSNNAIEALRNEYVDFILTDYKMSDINGIETLKKIKEINPRLPVVIVTGYGSIKNATKAMKLGAWDYITKPVDPVKLKTILEHIEEHITLVNENKCLKDKLNSIPTETEIIYESTEMKEVMNMVGRIAQSNSSVLIQGETGTGKEVLAKTIHNLSGRQGNFVPVHCAAIPNNLFESTLFGHEKGAFTGANKLKRGEFEIANNGTLFLDEIGDIPEEFQVKLLRVLQDHKFQRLGSSQKIEANVRIVSATNKDIEQLIKQGEFRKDLNYRLNVITIDIPPLRVRKEDIPPLIDHFIEKYSDKSKNVEGVSSEALDMLLKYNFPGNIRELENIIERAILLTRNDIITTEELPLEGTSCSSVLSEVSLTKKVESYEKALIKEAMKEAEDVQVKAANLLCISESTLRYKLDKYFN